MAVAKKSNYVEMELEWLEGKSEELKRYVDGNPIDKLVDRVAWKEIRGGGKMPVVVSTIEQQIKSLRDTLADYIKIIDAINKMREVEAAKKKAVRGDQQLSPIEEGII